MSKKQKIANANATWRIASKYRAVLSKNEAIFLLENGEKQIADSIDTNKLIIDKANSLLTLTTAILIAIIGFAITRWIDNKYIIDQLCKASLYAGGYFFVLSCFVLYILIPAKYHIVGAEPKPFFNDYVFNDKYQGEQRELLMMMNQIEEYQTRIEHNKKENKKRWVLFTLALICLVIAPILFAIYYFTHL